ncbi:MAG: penicillin-binding protein 2, partial [Clostridium baratii]|nr:penicillin-binding protein 2 [Clostridium baratii]
KVGYKDLMEYSEKMGLFKRTLNMQGEGRNETEGVKPAEDESMSLISIGQSMNTSPIQMLGAVNTFVNNGVYVKP